MNEDFFQNISSTGNPIEYADTVQRYQTQLPLGISWPTVTGSLNPGDLYTDDTSLYMYYPSGVNRTAIAIQQRDRYGGITFTLVSGSTNLYIQASEYFADPNPAFISSPYTVSGEGGTNLISASYSSDTPENPQNYWINLPNPGTYKVVFPNPVISTAFSVTHSGSSPYIFSQMLPRKSIGSYDIDVNSIRAYHVTASFIDAVAIQVSDSIVVGPDLIGAKSIDGSKIIDGTISGVLIQNGTVTGNKILAGTISGSLIQAGTITADNIASNTITASKIAGATITFNEIASNTLTAAQIADGAITGRKILDGTISGVLIQDDAISSSKIQANAITASKIAAGTITANEIAVSGITAINLQAGAVTADKISARVITAEKIVLSGITAELLGAEAVTAAALASGAVISGKIAADSIYASNIVGGQITAYHVAANTITGDRIQANTISGALMTAGTITANEIAVGSISADRLNVTQLDAVAANMGNLVVNSGISIGTNGTIWAGTGDVGAPETGLKIYTTGGVSRLTTYNASTPQVDIDSNGKLTAGEGNVVLDSTGISIGSITTANPASEALRILGSGGAGNIVGMAFYNGSYSPTNPQITIQADSTNALEIENNAVNGLTNFNFPVSGLANSAAVQIYNGNLILTKSPNPPENIVGGTIYGIDSDGTTRYKLGPDELVLNNNTSNTFAVNTYNGDIVTLGRLDAQGNITTLGTISSEGTLSTESLLYVAFDPVTGYQFSVNLLGDVNTKGGIFAGTSNNKFTVQSATGNTAIAGTLGVTSTTTLNGNFLQYNYGGLYKNTAQTVAAGADAKITFQVSHTNGTIDNVANSRLTIVYAGFYIISAGVMGNVVNTWQVVTGGAFGSGIVLANIIQTDMRAYATKHVYLPAGTNLELWVRNSGASALTVTTGASGTVLSIAKVG